MEDLLRFNFDQKYVILDTETEGLNLLNSRPWQISWITAKGKSITSKNDRYVKWDDLKVSPEAARITRFDRFQYDKVSEEPSKVLEDLWKVLSDPSYLIIGQNILGYDIYILNVLRKFCGRKSDYSYINRILDTRCIAMAIAMGHKQINKSDLNFQFKLLSHRDKKIKTSQASLLKHYQIDHDPNMLHNALVDIECTFKIFLKQIQEVDI